MVRLLFVPVAILALVACKPTEAAFCERLDECNSLATGVSVDECTNDIEDGFADLSDSDEQDCRNEISQCLENESCDNFVVCVFTDAVGPCNLLSGTTYYYYTF